MEEWFVGPIMEKIIEIGFEYLKDQCRWQTGMKKELQRLLDIHPQIKAVVRASSQVQIRDQNPDLNEWIWQLRDGIDEADDLLDEFDYMKHKEQLTRNKEKTKKRKLRSITSFLIESARKFRKVGERALKIDPNLQRLEEVVQKLDRVSASVGTFLHLLENTKLEQEEQQQELYKTRETGSLPKDDLIGRVEEKKLVMQWLKKPSKKVHQTHVSGTTRYTNISLLSIVGHGGMGKTTLLQHAYENEMTKEFDVKMWVCVSNNFDVKRVIADMLEYLKMERPRLERIGTLQEALKSEVTSKKFLLVLDDIWEEDERKWENVLAPLAYGSLGSKILISTRMKSVALTIAKVLNKKEDDKILILEGLKENECLQLLNNHAFANLEDPEHHKKLKYIAEKIAERLSGSPLAAKVIGGVLNSSFDERHWEKVLRNAIGSHNDIFSILRLSYEFLPKHLQICFAFCCIFQQDHMFVKDDLVRKWIALGFIQPSYNQGETMEDIGKSYFNLLVKKSFFHEFQLLRYKYYKMHDLLHDLAQSVCVQECFRVVGDEELPSRIFETVRHLSVETDNLEVLRNIMNFKKLRSLHLVVFISLGEEHLLHDILAEIVKASRRIRLLDIDTDSNKMAISITCSF